MNKIKNKSNTKKILLIVLLLVVLSFAGFFYVRDKNTAENQADTAPATVDNETTTTSDSPSAQADFESNDSDNEKSPGNSISENDGTGVVVETDETVDNSNPLLSEDTQTSLVSPSENQLVKNGTIISGTTKNSNVYFRLIDNKSGVIGEGQLKITSGKFSGKFQIESHGTEGRLDIFSRKSDGTEFSSIYVEVTFQ